MLIDTVECSLERLLAPRLDDVHVRSSDRSALWGHPAWNRRTEYRDCDRGRSAWQPASSHGFVAGGTARSSYYAAATILRVVSMIMEWSLDLPKTSHPPATSHPSCAC